MITEESFRVVEDQDCGIKGFEGSISVEIVFEQAGLMLKRTPSYNTVSGRMYWTTAVLQGGDVAVATPQEKLPRLQRRALHLSEVLDSRAQPRQRKSGHDREHRG